MRWRRFARFMVSAVFLLLAVWLFLGGEHLLSLLATLMGIVIVGVMETRAERRFADRETEPS